ncbi:manganese efflux pump [Romboutsia ilealis]|uniref:Putative manganese efflux pump MntP n=1 Tax=Romboutsia faecis TaxID=2764597 RepID=A0ABR7JS56_9FIRM|nr:manganese efflux pump MntP family protein [Romboutsia faecis]MBC5997612.1 manganese efflux pump [Romboutsia faecis]MRN25438.1 manganese efflux pump [Romboutsia ilealis]
MSFISVFLMSFALAMDAFAVSMTKGMTLRKINFSIASKIALFFGIFQGIMPLIGWFIGIRFESYIKTVDHWIALFLLGFIGLKMILEAKNDNSLDDISYDKLGIKELIVLSIATSIDALAVGVSFAFLNEPIFSISSTIAIVTFILCFLGVLLGKSIGSLFKNYAQIVGGIILILIGFNILNGHTGIITSFF